MNKKECVLLITGCIEPSDDVPYLVLKDLKKRKEQYIESILYYIEKSNFQKIVYCDNSDVTPDSNVLLWARKYNKEFEWLSFKGNNTLTIEKGKGFGECEIIKYAMENSVLLTDEVDFVKVTGRLIVKNINLLTMFKDDDIRFWPVYTEDNKLYIITKIYKMPVSKYKIYFSESGKYVDDRNGIYLEHSFGMCIRKNKISCKKFQFVPWIEGVSGSTGMVYKPTINRYIKDLIKLWMFKYPQEGEGNAI